MLEWIISSSVLIAVVIALRFALKGKISLRLQYALWALVLVRLIIPFSFGSSSLSVMNSVEQSTVYQTTSKVVTTVQVPSDIIRDSELTIEEAEQVGQGTLHRVEGYPVESGRENLHTYSFQDSLKEVGSRVLRIVWICGMCIMGLWFAATNLILSIKLRRNRTVHSYENCPLPVYTSDAVDTPCLFGLFRPAVYLTSEAASDEATTRHAVEHELTHYIHKDHIWAILRGVCLAVHWYNPLVWWAAILSRNDAELACDEATIRRLGESERAAYGRTLIGLTCEKRTALLNTATTMTGSGKSIKERIALIAKKPKMAVYTLVAVILIAAIAVGCTFTGATEEPHSFTEWTESLTAEDIQLAEVSKAYGVEKTSYILTVSEYQSLCSMLNGIVEDDCSVMKPKGSNEDGYRMALYRADKLWLFKCLSDGTIGLMFNDAETGAYFGCEGSLLIIDCPDLWSFIVRMVDEKGTMSDDTSAQTVLYASIDEYVKHRIDQQQVASYYSATEEEELTAAVLDAKVGWLEKQGEVFGLAPNGVLEAWYYNILLKLETDSDDIVLVGGQYEEDGYFDLEGQGGRIVVALRNADGKYNILYDAVINDGMDFYGYCNTVEEAIHDWYVKQYDLEIPLYATEWIDCITVPEDGSLSSVPVHRFDGDGWYIYIPIQVWNCPENAEVPCVFTSAYSTGSMLKVDYFDYVPAGLSDDHRKQGFTLIDEENLIWSRNSGGVNTFYYCFDAQDGGCWRVTIEWIDANITNYPYIAMEPDILQLMAESFTVYGSKTVTTLPVLELSREEYDAICTAVMIDLKSGWWTGGELTDCAYEASAFECVYRETEEYVERFYGYAGYFRFDENGNCVQYWYAPSIATLDATTKQYYNVWWPGDGAYHEMDILACFPDEIAEFVAEPNEERCQVICDRLLTTAKGRMVSETPQDVINRLSLLTAEDIKHTAGFCEVDKAELAALIGAATVNRIDRQDDFRIIWDIEVYLSGGPNSYNTGTDEWLRISAGLQENVVEIRYTPFPGRVITHYVNAPPLYWMVRNTYRTEEYVDEDAFARYGDILSARAQARVDGSKLNEVPYTGYEIVYLAKVDEFMQDGEKYEIYEWDVAFLHDNPITTLAGGMWVDSDLRIRSLDQETYFVTRTSGDLVDYQFFFYDLYFGQDEDSGRANAHATITEVFHSSQDVQPYETGH